VEKLVVTFERRWLLKIFNLLRSEMTATMRACKKDLRRRRLNYPTLDDLEMGAVVGAFRVSHSPIALDDPDLLPVSPLQLHLLKMIGRVVCGRATALTREPQRCGRPAKIAHLVGSHAGTTTRASEYLTFVGRVREVADLFV
jgi:hypothetical protein